MQGKFWKLTTALLTVTALGLTTAVVTAPFTADAAYAKDGKGGGKKKEKKSKPSNRAGAAKKTKPATKPVKTSAVKASAPQAAPKPKNLHAQLKGLNSLKRNINGLMNSSDPKMAGFRDFVIAAALLEQKKAAAADAQTAYDAALAAYAEMATQNGYDADPVNALTALNDQMTALTGAEPAADDPAYADAAAYDAAHAEWEAQVTALQGQIETVNGAITSINTTYGALAGAEVAVETATAGTTEDDLTAAIVAGMQASGQSGFTADDITPEMMEWISTQLGVDDAEGAIDAYLEQMAETETTEAVPADQTETDPA
ncbi:MAG: hypothetical protein R3256_11975 [Thalassovita sp.]|nr:hypothetical protein [Thalassovita sp.]